MLAESDNPLISLRSRIIDHLGALYPQHDPEQIADRIFEVMRYQQQYAQPRYHTNLWDQSDIVAITYGNTFNEPGRLPLHSLHEFARLRLKEIISIIHILPFYPYSSDDGFSVTDYCAVNPALGDWTDIKNISGEFRLMADLVINHCSSEHEWFINFQNDEEPGRGYFVTCYPDVDLSKVVRPRTSPLLRETTTARGTKHVWCTFSHDQVDLNFENPEVLLEVVRIIRLYLDQGITVFRLDAVAFLWKIPGTPCINLAETHGVIRLLRLLIEHVDPNAIIITETNIPNRENLSYFGNANEAHLIYNFSLPPLVLFTMLSGNSSHLRTWMMSMPPAQNGTAYYNFIASHDGIGLRPVEGILEESIVDLMAEKVREYGGDVSCRSLEGGRERPYELNISLFDAMKGTFDGPDDYQFERFVCAHAIMLALEGIPAFYIHSLLATQNDHDKVKATGSKRAINRHEWQRSELCVQLDDVHNTHARVFDELARLITIRKRQRAFHPNATQFTMHFATNLFAFWRQSMDRAQSIFCIYNVTNKECSFALQDVNLVQTQEWHDLVTGERYTDFRQEIVLGPYQFIWITNM